MNFFPSLDHVRELIEAGLSVESMASLLSLPFSETLDMVCELSSDPMPDDPSPDEIAAACEEIKAGWPPGEREARRHGETRRSFLATRKEEERAFRQRCRGK